VLLHCWLGHLTCKIVFEMTCNVSSGMLNPTIPYHRPTIPSPRLLMTSHPWKGRGQSHMTHFQFPCPQSSLEWLKQESQNFVCQ